MRFNSIIPSLVGAAALVLAVAQPAGAQVARPRRGQFEVQGLDFRPNGAWRQPDRERPGPAAGAAGLRAVCPPERLRCRASSATVVTGAFKLPGDSDLLHTIPTAPLFPRRGVPGPPVLAGACHPAVQPQDLLRGAVQREHHHRWHRLPVGAGRPKPPPTTRTAATASSATDLSRFGALLVGTLATVSNGSDSLTVWAQYDNDGPDGLPNSGDDDGVVDFVTFLQPEIDGACGTAHIWAHRYVIQGVNGGSAVRDQDQPRRRRQDRRQRLHHAERPGRQRGLHARPDHADRHGGARDRPRLRPPRPLRHRRAARPRASASTA